MNERVYPSLASHLTTKRGIMINERESFESFHRLIRPEVKPKTKTRPETRQWYLSSDIIPFPNSF